MKQFENLKVALVHDFLTAYGGAERVLEVFSEMFPEAPIYTLLHDENKMRGKFQGKDIRTSFLQRFPKFLRERKKLLLPFMMVAPEVFDLRDFDLVLSSSGAWSKGIVTRLSTVHVSYVHSPMRFVWDENAGYLKGQRRSFITNFFARGLMNYLRIWDRMAADRPDHLLANSEFTKKRIEKYYGRESAVIYPPVTVPDHGKNPGNNPAAGLQSGLPDEKYFLIVSRLSEYKNVVPAVQAFNKLELPLVVVGEGEQEKFVRKIAGKNVHVIGWQPDSKMADIISGARAFIFPCLDDFGIAPLEAMGLGVPVIALKKGGALETVEEGRTGDFFEEAQPELIADGVRRFIENESRYEKDFLINQAGRFKRDRFIKEISEYLNKILNT